MSTWGRATHATKRNLARIARVAAANSTPIAPTVDLVERHLRNRSAKAVALRKVTNFGVASLREAMDRADRMDLFEPQRSHISWRYEEKAWGRHRIVCDLPIRMRVGQHMAKQLIHAQHTPRSHIFDWPGRGGCPGAVATVRDKLNSHGRYVVVADIRDCHPTFNPEYIYNTNLLPPEFVSAMLDSRQFRYRVRGAIPPSSNHTEHTRPRGLLQGGAASSALLALALDDLPDHLPDGVEPIIQSDNIILVCRSKIECEAADAALGRYLRDNPAGAFSPRIERAWLRPFCDDSQDPDAIHWPRSFEQFGYAFAIGADSQCEVRLSQSNTLKTMGRLHDYVDNLEASHDVAATLTEAVEHSLVGFPARSMQTDEFFEATAEPDFVLACCGSNPRSGSQANDRHVFVDGVRVRVRDRISDATPWRED